MEYTVRVWSAMAGDVVPLIYVAQAMARHAASGHGTMSVHWRTLEEIRPRYIAVLLDAANRGDLTVCNQFGRIASVKELADAAEVSVDAEAMDTLIHLYTKAHSLSEWGRTRGDVFHFAETPGQVMEYDLKDFTGGFGADAKVLEAGYYRSTVGGGESEPWHDTVTATPAPVVAVGASGGVEPGKAGPPPVEQGLSTKDIAACFGDCYYSADNWPKRLSGTAWLKPARIGRGEAGGASAVWNPLTLAQLMHGKKKDDKAKEKLMNTLNSRFTLNPALGPWRDAFNEYFATHCATD